MQQHIDISEQQEGQKRMLSKQPVGERAKKSDAEKV